MSTETFFRFDRDFDGNVPLATLAHTMVVNYLEGGAKLLDMVIEAEENLTGSPPGTMLANFHYAMRHQCMTFTGEILHMQDERNDT